MRLEESERLRLRDIEATPFFNLCVTGLSLPDVVKLKPLQVRYHSSAEQGLYDKNESDPSGLRVTGLLGFKFQ